jgi:hypothetical protein
MRLKFANVFLGPRFAGRYCLFRHSFAPSSRASHNLWCVAAWPPTQFEWAKGAIDTSSQGLVATVQLRHCRLQQDEISTRLARVEADYRVTLWGECEAFRLATEIAEPPRIEERGDPATFRKIIETRNREGLIAE